MTVAAADALLGMQYIARTGPRRCGPGGGSNALCNFLVLADGPWLQEEWKDTHDWFVGRLAPKTWRKSLARFAPDNMQLKRHRRGFTLVILIV